MTAKRSFRTFMHRLLTSLTAIAAVSTIFGAKAYENSARAETAALPAPSTGGDPSIVN